MSVDLELLLTARNYALKLQEAHKQSNKACQRRVQTLEEALESVEAERNELRRKYDELHRACLLANKEHERVLARQKNG